MLTTPVSRFTMRCMIQRTTEIGRDDYNQPLTTNIDLPAIRCFAWSTGKQMVYDKDKTAFVEDCRMMVELDSGVLDTDTVLLIKDRADRTLFDGPLRIMGMVRKYNHIEVALEKVT